MSQKYPVSFEGQSPDEFGHAANRVGIITIPLDTARTSEEYTLGGSMLWAIDATSLDATCKIQFNDYTSGEIPYGKGQFIRGMRFSQIYVTNTAQAGESITFVYATEEASKIEIANALLSLQEVNLATVDPSVNIDVSVTDPGEFSTIADGNDVTLTASTVTSLGGTDTTRRQWLIQSDPANTAEIRIGSALISATRGLRLQPGDTLILDTGAVINAFTTASGQVVTISRLNN